MLPKISSADRRASFGEQNSRPPIRRRLFWPGNLVRGSADVVFGPKMGSADRQAGFSEGNLRPRIRGPLFRPEISVRRSADGFFLAKIRVAGRANRCFSTFSAVNKLTRYLRFRFEESNDQKVTLFSTQRPFHRKTIPPQLLTTWKLF